MKIDAALVRALRVAKSWSQEHLASAAGLSARTVQRVEAEGTGSGETRLALAAALDVPVSRISPVARPAVAPGHCRGRFWGWLGFGVGAVGALSGLAVGVAGGERSAGELGACAGAIGALLGVGAAVLGGLGHRVRVRSGHV